MNREQYIGKICPYCKTPLREDEEIVVCSNCEMPHHKDCWIDNQGCTTFGCTGTIQSVNDYQDTDEPDIAWQSITEPDEPARQFCSQCGAETSSDSLFCHRCGNRLNQTARQFGGGAFTKAPVQNRSDGYRSSVTSSTQNAGYGTTDRQSIGNGVYPSMNYQNNEYRMPDQFNQNNESQVYSGLDEGLLIGTNQEYYLPVFSRLRMQNTKVSWNWCAFLFAPQWLFYRKMYGYGAAAFGGLLLFTLMSAGILALLVYVVTGILGNYLYMNTIEKKSLELRNISEMNRQEYIRKQGGTSLLAAVLAIIAYSLVYAFLLAMIRG